MALRVGIFFGLVCLFVAGSEDSSTTNDAVTTIPAATTTTTAHLPHCDCRHEDHTRKRLRECRVKYHAPTKSEEKKVRKAEWSAYINCTAEHARDMSAVEFIERLYQDDHYRKEVYDCFFTERKAHMLAKGLAPHLSSRAYKKCLADAMKIAHKKA
ncbi:uncharacterized protein LOC144167069 [Haemaphysalis longicornis]